MVHLKIINMVKLMFCIFYHNENVENLCYAYFTTMEILKNISHERTIIMNRVSLKFSPFN